MAPDRSSSTFEPGGYCPRCDYRTDHGTCPECGLEIPPSRLRRKPRPWLRRHGRLIVLVVLLATLGGWGVAGQPQLVRYLPTFCLLRLRSAENEFGSQAVRELAKRYVGKRLTPEEASNFVRRGVEFRWETAAELTGPWSMLDRFYVELMDTRDLMYARDRGSSRLVLLNRLKVQRTAAPGWLPLHYEENVVGLRVDGIDSDASLAEPRVVNREAMFAQMVSKDGFRESDRHIRSKHGNSTIDGFVLTDLAAGEHNIEIDTAVTVTDWTSGRVVATWPASHRIVADVKPPPPRTLERRWRQGMEDLLFPYGKVPGEFDPEDH